jgi:uncharacterized membrane-anchored protein
MQVDETIQQTEAIVRFAQEVDRRLAEFGVNGASELVALHRQLKDALAQIEIAELDTAARDTALIVERLHALGAELTHLCTLKAAFEIPH